MKMYCIIENYFVGARQWGSTQKFDFASKSEKLL